MNTMGCRNVCSDKAKKKNTQEGLARFGSQD